MITRICSLVFSFVLFFPIQAQEHDLYLYGQVTDAITGTVIPAVVVVQQDRGGRTFTTNSTAAGYFLQELSTDDEGSAKYSIQFRSPGYVVQEVILDVRDMANHRTILLGLGDPMKKGAGWIVDMDIALKPALRPSMKSERIAKCSFSRKANAIGCKGRGNYSIATGFHSAPSEYFHSELYDEAYEEEGTTIHGYVRDHWTNERLADAVISIRDHITGEEVMSPSTGPMGFYIQNLPYDKAYRITFSKQGMVSKTIVIDLTGIPDHEKEGGFTVPIDIRLFPPIQDASLDFLSEPLGYLRYDPEDTHLRWDMSITTPLLERMNGILERERAKR